MIRSLFEAFTWKMAWREARFHRKKLFLFVASIILGVAALVAIQSLGVSLEREVDQQARTLLGADLAVRSNRPFSKEIEEKFQSWGGVQSREVRLTTMVLFPESDGMRLSQVRALEGDFPFYGRLETVPQEAARSFRQGPYALVDDRVMLQFDVEVGDPIRIGGSTFRVAGTLSKIPGEAMTQTLISPRVFIPLSYLEETGLLREGGRFGYRKYFKFSADYDLEEMLAAEEAYLRENRIRTDTVEERKAQLGRSMDNLYRYLSLTGFIALLLGGIGVASSIHVYVREKLTTVGILRCLGTTSGQASLIYLIQTAFIAFGGALLGAALGILIQTQLPALLADFLPLTIPIRVSWMAVAQGIVAGLGFALLFALLPLLRIRRVSPLLALRFSYELDGRLPKEPLRWLVYAAIVSSIVLFSILRTARWTHGLAYALGILVVFALLAAVARLITFSVRRYFPSSWSYVWRQGLANLYRPNNQTVIVMLSLGLGTFLIATLYLVQSTLIREVTLAGSGGKANLVLFDIQSDQRQEVLQMVESSGLPVLQDVPIVTMRLASINTRSVQDLAEDPESRSTDWALFREYRSTYREHLIDSEELVRGSWLARVSDAEGVPLISLEERIAEDLGVGLGDQLVFDVQGVPIEVTVGSLRKVDWERIQTNFFVVFPTGILEEAPQFHVLMTRTETPEESAGIQRSVVRSFPNVSTVDLALVLETVDAVLERGAFVIRVMAMFSILTAIVVLIGAVASSRYQRARESVLLRTLGASRRQVTRIMAVEYLFLGFFAALTGLILALGASWSLALFVFEVPLVLDILPTLVPLVVVVGLTLLVGVINSWGLSSRPPLEVLRVEV